MSSNLNNFIRHDLLEKTRVKAEFKKHSLRPILIHVHIPKCAGTSFNQLLRNSLGQQYSPLYQADPGDYWNLSRMKQLVADRPQVLAIASHAVRLYPRQIDDRFPLYVAFLRDPLDWVLSNMTYLIANYDQLTDVHRANLPDDCDQMSVRELLAWNKQRNERDERPQINMLSHVAEPTAATNLHDHSSGDLLTLGKHLIDQFFFVGMVEQMPQSLRWLAARLVPFGIDISKQNLPELNVTRQLRGDTDWIHPNDPIGNYVLTRLAPDRKLYQHVSAKFIAASNEYESPE